MKRRTRGSRLAQASFFSAVALAMSFTSIAHAKVDLGLGLMGSAGGNFLDKPDRNQFEPDIYPGYGGLTLGGGFVFDARFLDELLGIEVDLIRSTDKGKGDVTFSNALGAVTLKHTLGQSSWHVPVLAKLTIKSPIVAPQFFLGPEFVFPSTPESTLDPAAPGLNVTATADNYVVVTGGAGVEIKLPLPVLDLRIPIGLRVSYNPSVPADFADRVTVTSPTSVAYHSEWKYAVNLTLGATLFF